MGSRRPAPWVAASRQFTCEGPVVLNDMPGRIEQLQIAAHDLRRAHGDLTDLARRDILSRVSHEAQIHAAFAKPHDSSFLTSAGSWTSGGRRVMAPVVTVRP